MSDGDKSHLVVKALTSAGWKVDARDFGGSTPLHEAAASGTRAEEKTQAIIAGGRSDVNAADREGTTPLHAACYGERRGAIDALIGAGADPRLKDDMGLRPSDLVKDPALKLILEEAIVKIEVSELVERLADVRMENDDYRREISGYRKEAAAMRA
jgi:ankyrin repeat protein